MRLRRILLGTLAAAACAFPAVALANAAPPWIPGDIVGEPNGELVDVHIEREELRFDLRPLANGAPVPVSATYHLRNDGDAQRIDLAFVADALADAANGVWLDGRAVPTATGDAEPDSPPTGEWRPPTTTPSLSGGQPIPYTTRPTGALRFTVDLSPGSHDLQVRYAADAAAYSGNSPARYWQLGYVLAPAREWGSFGTLDVSVELPEAWSFAAEPPLSRTGDAAQASFPGIPADAIALTAQMPIPVSGSNYVPAIVVGVLSLLGVLLAAFLGARRGRQGRSAAGLIGLSIVWACVTAVAGIATATVTNPGLAIPDSQGVWGYNYSGPGDAFLGFLNSILMGIAVIMVLTVAMQLVAALFARRASSPGQARG